jgi:hypothetical protein
MELVWEGVAEESLRAAPPPLLLLLLPLLVVEAAEWPLCCIS